MQESTDQPAKRGWSLLGFCLALVVGCGRPPVSQPLPSAPRGPRPAPAVQAEPKPTPKPDLPVPRWPLQGNVWDCLTLIVPIFEAHEAVLKFEDTGGPVNKLSAEAIARLGGQQAAARKLTLYLRYTQPSPERKDILLSILDRSGLEDPVPGLVLLLKDPEVEADTRHHIVHLLSDEHGGPWSVAPLTEALLRDPDAGVRAKAAEELLFLVGYGKEHDQVIAAALEKAAKDSDEKVRNAAADGLEKIRGKEQPK